MFNTSVGNAILVYFFRKADGSYALTFSDRRNATRIILGLEELFQVFGHLEDLAKDNFKCTPSWDISTRPNQWGFQTLRLDVTKRGDEPLATLGVLFKDTEDDLKVRRSRFYCQFAKTEILELLKFKSVLIKKLIEMKNFEELLVQAYVTIYHLYIAYNKENVYSVPDRSWRALFFSSLKLEQYQEQFGMLTSISALKEMEDLPEQAYTYIIKSGREKIERLFEAYGAHPDNIEAVRATLNLLKEKVIRQQINPFVTVNAVTAEPTENNLAMSNMCN
jgi:hypothetical protein